MALSISSSLLLRGYFRCCWSSLKLGLGGPDCNEEVDGLGVTREVDLHTAAGVSKAEGSTQHPPFYKKKYKKIHNH